MKKKNIKTELKHQIAQKMILISLKEGQLIGVCYYV